MRRCGVPAACAALALLTIPATTALADTSAPAPTYAPAVQLPGSMNGGEPSIAVDPRDPHNVYVTAPQSIPAVLTALLWSNGNGVAFWRSTDGGSTWKDGVNIGTLNGGADSDVEVDRTNSNVYVADLEAAAAAICKSTDHGASFTSANDSAGADSCTAVSTDHQGPDNDREWLNSGPHGELYLTYHDFSANVPMVQRSDDGGASFVPCGSILDPNGPAGQNYSPVNGDLIAKPVVGPDGTMYVEVTEPPHATTQAVNANLSNLYMAVAEGGCTGTTVFKNYLIYDGSADGAQLGQIFNTLTSDAAGNLYVLAAGRLKSSQPTNDVYLFVSRDHGKTWSAPQQVNPPTNLFKSNAMPAAVGGLGGGQIAVGWFGCGDSGDPNTCQHWHYYASQSTDYGNSWTGPVDLLSGVAHYGNICTVGINCGTPADGDGGNGNRDLADFSSASIDPATGAVMFAFPGDPDSPSGQPDGFAHAYFARETSGFLTATPSADLPEAPVAALVPIAAVAAMTAAYVIRRRRVAAMG